MNYLSRNKNKNVFKWINLWLNIIGDKMNKKAQGLSTNAIILIVLGVIVLVILAIGFFAGWEKIAPWIKPSNNVQEIADACSMACSMNSVYDYCSVKRELKIEETVGEFEDGQKYTCNNLSTETSFGIACSSITCPSENVEDSEED